ncbi:MAG: DUF4010 domain-containing protein [Gemmatimonadota bacterium]|nr:DUF4010 domain-containing protein [Gemmatimonadota bacterium]
MQRLALALAIGLFVGLDREHERKEAGLRTFAVVSLIGCVGALLGPVFALLAIALAGILVVLLNITTLRNGQGAELTTSAALILTAMIGVMTGMGQTLVPTVIAVATAALLAWKEKLHAFSLGLDNSELRSAILLAILAFVVYPLLPAGFVDRWNLVDLRAAWIVVIVIAGIGFANYILLRKYGAKGVEVTGFLGGVVNATLTIAEISRLDRETDGGLRGEAYIGIMLAAVASIVRNAVLLGVLAFAVLVAGLVAFAAMALGGLGLVMLKAPPESTAADGKARPPLKLSSPFSITAAIRYGFLFLCIQVASELAERYMGTSGFYLVSAIGGLVSSASAVASAALLAAHGTISTQSAAAGAVLATVVSILFGITFVARQSRDSTLTRSVAIRMAIIAALGVIGAILQRA